MRDLPSITYFPVGNADTSLIELKEDINILIDCQFTDDPIFNIPDYLRSRIKEINGIYHLDVLIVSHPHNDHILGFSSEFYCGDPKKFTETDKKAGKILIDEIWFSPRIFNNLDDLSDDAKIFKKEAARRIECYRENDEVPGNRIQIIGATDNEDYADLDEIMIIAGEETNKFNNKYLSDFRLRVFAPVKKDSDDDSIDLNNSSIVLLTKFDVDGEEEIVRAFFGGDAEYQVWERIYKKNSSDLEAIKWDIFLAPHHCSWTFFNDINNDVPNESSLKIIELHNDDGKVIVSSKSIKNNTDNPPSYKAKMKYISAVGKNNFFCTGDYPDNNEENPIYITMSSRGYSITNLPESTIRSSSSFAIGHNLKEPRTYG